MLLLAIGAGYVLVLAHDASEHASALSPDKCVVCSWAKALATIGGGQPAVALVCAAGRLAPPRFAPAYRSSCRLPSSARSPPPPA